MSARAQSQSTWSAALSQGHSAGVPFFVITPGKLSSAQYFQDSSGAFDRLSPRVAGAVNCWLAGLFCNLMSPPATSVGRIADEPTSCQSILRFRHQTVIAPVGYSGRRPPVVKQIFNNSSSVGTPVAWCARLPIGYTDTCSFRWINVYANDSSAPFSAQIRSVGCVTVATERISGSDTRVKTLFFISLKVFFRFAPESATGPSFHRAGF